MAGNAEAVLKKLRRLEGNMICPNCGTHAVPGVGFGNVCVKFKTFICDLCKTSHQAISHRVKSFSMSTWTMDEVLDLSIERQGGNDACLHVWLANAPPPGGKYPGGSRPKSGDDVNVFKKFVVDCYESGKFKAATPFNPVISDRNSSAAGSGKSVGSNSSSGSRVVPQPAQVARAVSNKAVSPKSSLRKVGGTGTAKGNEIDLLGFDNHSSPPAPGADFGAFGSAPSGFDPFSSPQRAFAPSVSVRASSAPGGSPTSPFGAFIPAPSGAPAPAPQSSFDPFGSSSTMQPASAAFSAFSDPFGGSSAPAPAPAPAKKAADVLSLFDQPPPAVAGAPAGSAMWGGASAISGMMAVPPRPVTGQMPGMGMGMGMGVGGPMGGPAAGFGGMNGFGAMPSQVMQQQSQPMMGGGMGMQPMMQQQQSMQQPMMGMGMGMGMSNGFGVGGSAPQPAMAPMAMNGMNGMSGMNGANGMNGMNGANGYSAHASTGAGSMGGMGTQAMRGLPTPAPAPAKAVGSVFDLNSGNFSLGRNPAPVAVMSAAARSTGVQRDPFSDLGQSMGFSR